MEVRVFLKYWWLRNVLRVLESAEKSERFGSAWLVESFKWVTLQLCQFSACWGAIGALPVYSVPLSVRRDLQEKAGVSLFSRILPATRCTSPDRHPPLLLLFSENHSKQNQSWVWPNGFLIKLCKQLVTTRKHNAHRQLLNCGTCGNTAPCPLDFAQDLEAFGCQIRFAAGWCAESQRAGAMHGFNL